MLFVALGVAVCALGAFTAFAEADPAVAKALERLQVLTGRWSVEWESPETVRAPKDTGSARAAGTQLAHAEDPELRRRAVELARKDGRAPRLRELLWALGDPDPGVRAVALEAVAPLSPAALLEDVLDVLVANGETEVDQLDHALPGLPPALGDEFVRVLRDTAQPVPLRRAAAYALGRLRAGGAALALAEGIDEAEATLAQSCALALYALRDTATVPVWIALREHDDYAIAWLAVQALAELGGRDAFTALLAIARGGMEVDGRLIGAAIGGLGAWPLGDCVPALVEVMQNNPGYRHLAANVLRARTGVALGDNAAEWAAWAGSGGQLPEAEPPAPEGAPNELLQNVEFVPPELRGRAF